MKEVSRMTAQERIEHYAKLHAKAWVSSICGTEKAVREQAERDMRYAESRLKNAADEYRNGHARR